MACYVYEFFYASTAILAQSVPEQYTTWAAQERAQGIEPIGIKEWCQIHHPDDVAFTHDIRTVPLDWFARTNFFIEIKKEDIIYDARSELSA